MFSRSRSKISIFVVLCLTLILLPPKETRATDWYVPGTGTYQYRKLITLNTSMLSASALTNFPVLISLTDLSLRTVGNGGRVQNGNGYDIIFTDASHTPVKWDHEIERYIAATGEIQMWVEIPSLSTTLNTTFYMYYGNSSVASSQENATGVWDANYLAVWHLKETPGVDPNARDSTVNARNGTFISGMTSADQVAGAIGGSLDFDNTINDRIDTSNFGGGIPQLTLQAWVRKETAGDDRIIAKTASASTNNSTYIWSLNNNASNITQARVATGGNNIGSGTHVGTDIPLTTWTHLAFTYDAANVRIYENGGLNAGPFARTGAVNTGSAVVVIGNNDAGLNDRAWDGQLDEVRVSAIARPAEWLLTEYNNQLLVNQGAGTGKFILSLGGEETPPASTIVTVSTSGSQPAVVTEGQTDVLLGTFTLNASGPGAKLTYLRITETGSIDAQTHLTNPRLYKAEQTTCSYTTGLPLVDPDNDPTGFSFEDATFIPPSPGLDINLTQLCLFLVVDVGSSAGAGNTIRIEVTSEGPGGIVVADGTVSGAFPVQFPGPTIIRADQGTVISSPIDFDWVSGQTSWNQAIWSTTETEGDVRVQVYYNSLGNVAGVTDCDTPVPDAALTGNAAGFDVLASPLNISGLTPVATTYNRLCLKATLVASGATVSPTLNDWQIAWQPPAGGAFTQSGYRFFTNLDSANVGAALAAQNTTASLTTNESPFRLRMLIHTGADLGASGQNFKLQYVGRGTGTCAAPVGGTPATYTDVTNATIIAFKDNIGTANNIALIDNAGELTHAADTVSPQTYHDSDTSLVPFTNSQGAIAAGADGKWDFSLFDNTAPSNATYCLRAESDGTPLTYTWYPEITVSSAYALTGTYTSNNINILPLRAWNVLEWSEAVTGTCPTCDIRLQIQTSADGTTWTGGANWCGPADTTSACVGTSYYTVPTGTRVPVFHNGHTWIRYRAVLDGNGTQSPILNRVRINYQ